MNPQPHIVDQATRPDVVPVQIDIARLRIDQTGDLFLRLRFKKPGYAITVDLTMPDAEVLENQIRATRAGIVLP